MNMTENLIPISGELDADIDFTHGPYQWQNGDTVRVVGSCATTLNDEMYLFGGQFVDHQVIFLMFVNRADLILEYFLK